MRTRNGDRGIGEAIAVLSAVGLIAAGITLTYARTPVDDLYNVSHVVTRGWTSREIPSLILPKSFGWAAVLAAVAFFALGARERARSRR